MKNYKKYIWQTGHYDDQLCFLTMVKILFLTAYLSKHHYFSINTFTNAIFYEGYFYFILVFALFYIFPK